MKCVGLFEHHSNLNEYKDSNNGNFNLN